MTFVSPFVILTIETEKTNKRRKNKGRKNNWFEDTFLKSFGTCKGRRVSQKQGQIFQRYLEYDGQCGNAAYYISIIRNKRVTLQISSCYNGCRYDSKGRHTLYRNEYFVSISENTKAL